jgi:hypothetical protein
MCKTNKYVGNIVHINDCRFGIPHSAFSISSGIFDCHSKGLKNRKLHRQCGMRNAESTILEVAFAAGGEAVAEPQRKRNIERVH